MTIQYGAD